MLKIYETIHSLYKEKFKSSTKEFKAGYRMALTLLEIGIRKSTSFNLIIKLKNQERLNTKLKTVNDAQRKEINNLSARLDRQLLVLPKPLDYYKQYDLEIDKEGHSIQLVINASKETVMMLWFYFLSKSTYTSVDECKSKFLVFLGSFTAKGFITYKDIKTYNKEVGNYDSKQR